MRGGHRLAYILDSYFVFYFEFASASYRFIIKWIGGGYFPLFVDLLLLSAYFDANERKKTCLRDPFGPSSNYIVYPRDNESLVSYTRLSLF